MTQDDYVMQIVWHANPFRGDKFEDAWRPAAEAALRFGATEWQFMRSLDDPLDFVQLAVFPGGKEQFERYWYSHEMAEARADASGYYQVPVLPIFFRCIGAGEIVSESAVPRAEA